MKKILITGAAGFIGAHLSRYLLENNSEIELVLVDNLQRGKMDEGMLSILENTHATFLHLDLTDVEAYKKFMMKRLRPNE